jgi:biotin carboxyl carrier protein
MKYRVRVADQSYEVEIEDINARPVIARIDGQEFKVDPENGIKPAIQPAMKELNAVEIPKQSPGSSESTNELTAPLPGTVIAVFVKAGDSIESGQVIFMIEAMKMKNSIRSTRAGKVAEVLVSAGETVVHKQALARFAD